MYPATNLPDYFLWDSNGFGHFYNFDLFCGHFVDRKIASKMDNMLTGDLAKYLCFGELMEDSGLNKRYNG